MVVLTYLKLVLEFCINSEFHYQFLRLYSFVLDSAHYVVCVQI